MSEMVLLTQFARILHLTFRLLVPPSISVLVIIISIFVLIPTLTIIFCFFLIPSRLLVPFGFDNCTESTLADWLG